MAVQSALMFLGIDASNLYNFIGYLCPCNGFKTNQLHIVFKEG